MKWYITTRKYKREITLTDVDVFHVERMVRCYQYELAEEWEKEGHTAMYNRGEQTCESLLELIKQMARTSGVVIYNFQKNN